jgi:hypothetical protein
MMVSMQLPRRRALAAFAGCALALAAPAAAHAKAVIKLEPTCYLSSATGSLTGSGFSPKATWTAKLDDAHTLGHGRVDKRGQITARFTAPVYHGTRGLRSMTLSVTDGPHVAKTTFQMSPLAATFSPRTGNPATLRVRWRVLGLGPRHGVYVHYVQPNGKLKKTLRIGTTHGACGTLKTGPIALFPFTYTYGRWTFQVDASKRYRTTTTPRLLIGFDVKKPSQGGDD